MTVRICISIPYIGPAIIVMFFSNFLSHELCDQILRKNEAKDTIFYLIIRKIYENSFWKGITQRHWNSSLIQIFEGYVTCLQYCMANKCRMLTWIHIKGIIFHPFNFWKSNLWNILITYICICTTQTIRLMY